ncbi:MAG: tetratricopeptide repeat protein, partial [Caldilineaceae bacterium]|nr:tetratricopeptide repeat protein [Caldilineaceae bacterium]
KLLQPVLLVAVLLLWAFPGWAKMRELNCGDLGCPEAGIRLRFGMTEEWTTNGDSSLLDAGLTLQSTRELLFQRLSCVDGLQGIDPVTDNVLDEIDLLLDGTLQIQSDLLLTVDLIDARTHQRLQSPNERQPLPADPIERERALAHLHNNRLVKLLRAIDMQTPAPTSDLLSRLTTTNAEAAGLNTAAVELMLNQQWPEATIKLQAALALDQDYATAHNNLGRAYRQQQQLAQAITQYEIAVELLPCVALYHYNLAFAYEEDQQYDRAIAAYKAALARNPAYTKALNNLGYLYLQQEELAVAAQYLDRGLAIDPNDAPLHKNRGRVYLAQGDLDNAISYLKQATILFPDYAEAYFFLAEAYERANQPEEACAALAAYTPLVAADALDDPERPSAAA